MLGGRAAGAARSTSPPASPRCGSPARWRARRSRASPRSTCARSVTQAGRLAPGLGGAHAGRDPVRGRGPLPDAVRRRARPVRVDGRRRRRRPPRRRPGRRRRARAGGPPVRDLFRKRRMWRPRPELKKRYDVVIVGGGSHGLATAYYLRAARHHRRRGAREELHRLGRRRAQHDDPALELQDARGRALLRRLGQALRGALQGAELQPAVQPVRAPHARAHRPRDVRDGQPRRGQPPRRHRQPADRPRRGPAAGAGDARVRRRHAPDHGRAVPPARRHHPPRRRRLGLRARRRRGRRRDPSLHRGHGARARERPDHRGPDRTAVASSAARSSTPRPAGAR